MLLRSIACRLKRMDTIVFPNRLCNAEERKINFDPFGNWAAEMWVHKRDLATYETLKKSVSFDQNLAERFERTYQLILKKYLMNFESPIANEYAASTLGGNLRLFLECQNDINSALDGIFAMIDSK